MRIYFLFLVLLLTACASKVSSIKQDNTNGLLKNGGYLLLGVQSNLDLKSLLIEGPKDVEISSADLKKGNGFVLIELPVGDYTLEELNLNQHFKRRLKDEENWHFKIHSGTINYIGHLEVITWQRGFLFSKVELVNRSSEALEFLEDKFTGLLTNFGINYGGPGEDLFFDFALEFQGEK